MMYTYMEFKELLLLICISQILCCLNVASEVRTCLSQVLGIPIPQIEQSEIQVDKTIFLLNEEVL